MKNVELCSFSIPLDYTTLTTAADNCANCNTKTQSPASGTTPTADTTQPNLL
jgi:hypothetical protein